MKVGGLFSGIGGFELGLTWAGMEIAWMVEINEFCQKVLKKHWPTVPIYGDIKSVTKEELGSVDLICGGFPCQPFSQAGKQRGKDDDRYLWPEMLRVIRELKPRWIIGENVAGFINMELENAFADLEGEGYKVEAFVLPAYSVGAPHQRDRIWIVAYPYQNNSLWGEWGLQAVTPFKGCGNNNGHGIKVPYWETQHQPSIHRVANGIPAGLDRLGILGNAVVPQIPEIIGRYIIEIEQMVTISEMSEA